MERKPTQAHTLPQNAPTHTSSTAGASVHVGGFGPFLSPVIIKFKITDCMMTMLKHPNEIKHVFVLCVVLCVLCGVWCVVCCVLCVVWCVVCGVLCVVCCVLRCCLQSPLQPSSSRSNGNDETQLNASVEHRSQLSWCRRCVVGSWERTPASQRLALSAIRGGRADGKAHSSAGNTKPFWRAISWNSFRFRARSASARLITASGSLCGVSTAFAPLPTSGRRYNSLIHHRCSCGSFRLHRTLEFLLHRAGTGRRCGGEILLRVQAHRLCDGHVRHDCTLDFWFQVHRLCDGLVRGRVDCTLDFWFLVSSSPSLRRTRAWTTRLHH